jgi:N-dimethylarginine dimethylaminohydrolase
LSMISSTAGFLSGALGIEVLALNLVDPRFYHLDTCFCPLDGGSLMYFPAAFDAASRAVIESRVPANRRIAIGEADAVNFACNAVNIDRQIVLNRASPSLVQALAARGFSVGQRGLGQFMKAGGAAKCLTLRLDEARIAVARVAVA